MQTAMRLQVLPYWTKGSLLNLAAVVCWRHAASMKPAAIQVTSAPGAGPEPDTDQDVADALSSLRMPENTMPLEVRAELSCSRQYASMHQVRHRRPYRKARLLWPTVFMEQGRHPVQGTREICDVRARALSGVAVTIAPSQQCV